MTTPVQKILVSAALVSLAACAATSSVSRSQSLTDTGFGYMKQKDYASAKPYFEQALEIEPKLAMAHLDLGAVYQHTGNPAQAKEHYRMAIANDVATNGYPRVYETTDGSASRTVAEIAQANLDGMR